MLLLVSALALPVSAHDRRDTMSINRDEPSVYDYYPQHAYGIENNDLYNRLKGRLIITPQRNGEAYYVSATEKTVYYLGDNFQALKTLQGLGYGANSATLNRVAAGYAQLSGYDADRDGLPDKFEEMIGTDSQNFNTDGDRYSDKTEIDHNYDPTRGDGQRLIMNTNLRGRIFLQVDRNGEAWYMNPVDSKKYWLNTPADMNNLITKFALGVSNYNFSQLVK